MAVKISAKNKTAEILLYEDIGEFWGIGARQFAKDVEALGKGINHFVMRINSNGGSVFEGVTIYNFMKAHKAKLKASLEVHVDGLAASIASIIAMVADKGELHMADNAWMMIHDPWSLAIGTANDMRKEADLLDGVRDTLLDTLMKRATSKREEISAMMAEETWLSAQDALEHGLIDVITEEQKMAASVRRGWFKHPPSALTIDNAPPVDRVPTDQSPVKNKRAQEIIARTRQSVRKHTAAGV